MILAHQGVLLLHKSDIRSAHFVHAYKGMLNQDSGSKFIQDSSRVDSGVFWIHLYKNICFLKYMCVCEATNKSIHYHANSKAT